MLGLTLSGAPSLALWLGIGGSVICATAQTRSGSTPLEHARSGSDGTHLPVVHHDSRRSRFMALALGTHQMVDVHILAKLIMWFTWPAWPLALWSLWRWRGQLAQGWRYPHLSLPLWFDRDHRNHMVHGLV
jgi:hypothetical protein